MSEAYQRFLDQYLRATSWGERKDGPPFELLDSLTADERARAEDELINRLSSWRDDWPIEGLGHLRTPKAEGPLRKLLPRAFGSMKAKIATAIWKISADESMLDVVLKQSQASFFNGFTSFYEFRQIDMIYCLAQFPQPEARARLEQLTRDRRYLIAYNAKRALGLRQSYYGIKDHTL